MKKLVLILPFFLLACNEKKQETQTNIKQITAEEFTKQFPNIKTVCRNGALYETVDWTDGSFLIYQNKTFVNCKEQII